MTPLASMGAVWSRVVRNLLPLSLLFALGLSLPLGAEDRPSLIVAQDRAWPPFAFLDSDGRPQGALVEVWQEIGQRLDRPVEFLLDGREFRITASASVAASCELQQGQDSARALLAMADRRLYRAKALRRDRVCGDDGEGGV